MSAARQIRAYSPIGPGHVAGRGLPVAHRLVHPAAEEVGADLALVVVDHLVQLVGRRGPREPALRVVDVAVEGGDRGVAQQGHPGIVPTASGTPCASGAPLVDGEPVAPHTVPMGLRRQGLAVRHVRDAHGTSRSVRRFEAVRDLPIVRRVAFHVNRIRAGLDFHFFRTLVIALVVIVAASAFLVTVLEPEKRSAARAWSGRATGR